MRDGPIGHPHPIMDGTGNRRNACGTAIDPLVIDSPRRHVATDTERWPSPARSDAHDQEVEWIYGTIDGQTGGSKKRKASPSQLRESDEDLLYDLATRLSTKSRVLAWSLRDTAFELKEAANEDYLAEMLRAVEEVVEYAKERKNNPPRREPVEAAKPDTSDATTDMTLTPHWWTSSAGDVERMPLADLGRPRTRVIGPRIPQTRKVGPSTASKSYAAVTSGSKSSESSDDGSDGDFKVVGRRRRRAQPKPTATKRDTSRISKPPAVLIKVVEGRSFEETLKAVQTTVDPEALGVEIKKITKTREGHVLVEMKGGPSAAGGAEALCKAVAEKAGERTGGVRQLGTTVDMEVVDIDPSATEEDVRSALVAAVAKLDGMDPEMAGSTVAVTGAWKLKSGMGIATARIPRSAIGLETVRIGWTSARIRPRRQEPQRCYRCHGFGHSATVCTGPDLAGACRKCGSSGHLERNCNEEDKCLACDRLGQRYLPHRTGSGGCLARRHSRNGGSSGPHPAKW